MGNPGTKYRGTRHNVGFDVIDEVARRAAVTFESAPVDALMARWRDRDAIVAKPLTFMNNSGQAIGELLRYFKIDVPDLVGQLLPPPVLRLLDLPVHPGHDALDLLVQLGDLLFGRIGGKDVDELVLSICHDVSFRTSSLRIEDCGLRIH